MPTNNNNVSVVITAFNSSQYISATLTSVMEQEDVNIEVLIVDDCSPDYESLQKIANDFSSKTPIYTFQPTQKGNANISRNIGIANAKYDYIAFLDADDTWNPKHLITCIDTINNNGWEGCFSKVNLISKNEIIKSTPEFQGNLCHFIFKDNGISVTSCLVIKKKFLSDITFNNELQKHQDWDFLIRFSNKYKIGQSPYYGLNYTLSTGENMSSKFNFKASVKFMNTSLPVTWHSIFLANFINKILLQRKYTELVILYNELKKNYNFSISSLGMRNAFIVYSAKSKVMFYLSSFIFRSAQHIKTFVKIKLR